MKRIVVILLTILILFTLIQGALRVNVANGDNLPIWPMFSYNAQHTGQCPYDTSWNTGKLKWRFDKSVSSVVIGSDGTIYGGVGFYLYAINADGTLKWQYRAGGEIFNSSPAISQNGTVYFGCFDYFIYAINPDGTLKWKFATLGYPDYSPVVSPDGTVSIGADDGNFYSINPDGTLKWKYKGGNYYSSAAVAIDGTIYVESAPCFYALNNTGILKWKYEVGGETAPVVAPDGTVYLGSWDHCLYSLAPSGTVKWKYETGNMIVSPPAVATDGTIYLGSGDGYFYALNSNGTLKWKYDCGSAITRSCFAISSEGTVYFVADQSLYALSSYGTLKWKFLSYSYVSSPAIGLDGTIYLGSESIGMKVYTITAVANQGGSISPSGIVQVSSGDSKTFTITPDIGYHIKDVLVDSNSVGAVSSYTFTNITLNHTIEATFTTNTTNTLTITVTASPGGSISPSGVVTVNQGDDPSFTITSDAGYHIADVKVDGVSVVGAAILFTFNYTFINVTASHTIAATFATSTIIDSVPPAVTITSPANGAEVMAASVKVEGKVTDNIGVVSLWIGAMKVDFAPDGSFIAIVELVEGTNNIKVSAFDAAGNKGEAIIAITYQKPVQTIKIVLQIGSTSFTVNGSQNTLDSPPIIKNSRTLLPIRAVIESLGGTVSWDSNEKKATVILGETTMELWIGKNNAKINDGFTMIDLDNPNVVPEIINSRTMLPLRFVTENLGCDVQWDGVTKTITITYPGS